MELSESAKLPAVGASFSGMYYNVIRNAVYHSDYTLADGEFRLLSGVHKSRKHQYISNVVDWDELNEILVDTFALYSALFSLYDRCRKSFGDFINAFIPFDLHYKGILQLLFDRERRICGFRVYWPNGTLGEFVRAEGGCSGANLQFDSDGSINFMVGVYASEPGQFSPLVERDQQPVYPLVPGTSVRPFWPDKLMVYKISEAGIQDLSGEKNTP